MLVYRFAACGERGLALSQNQVTRRALSALCAAVPKHVRFYRSCCARSSSQFVGKKLLWYDRNIGITKKLNSYPNLSRIDLQRRYNSTGSSNADSKTPVTQIPDSESSESIGVGSSSSSSSSSLPSESGKSDSVNDNNTTLLTWKSIATTFGFLSIATGIGAYMAYDQGNVKENLELATMEPAPVNVQEEDISKQLVDLTPITDEIFDHNDNLLVIVIADEAWFQNPTYKKNVKKLVKQITSTHPEVTPYFTVQETLAENTNIDTMVKFMTYKGHRKQHFTWDLSGQLEDCSWDDVMANIIDFYKFRSLPNFEIAESGIQTISANQFQEFVLDDSHHWPVLVQLYEETCFLCFLMRPMIQTLCLDREKWGLPCRIMRINVDENDFPKGLPMARGTPQFFLYNKGKCTKWEQFKPMDFVERLCESFKLSQGIKDEMLDLAEKVQNRFQMFTALVMWHMELKRMEDELQYGNQMEYDLDELIVRAQRAGSKDDGFNQLVSLLMYEDMQRSDNLADNMEHLQNEIAELEKDVCLLGMMLGKMVQEKEKRMFSEDQLKNVDLKLTGETGPSSSEQDTGIATATFSDDSDDFHASSKTKAKSAESAEVKSSSKASASTIPPSNQSIDSKTEVKNSTNKISSLPQNQNSNSTHTSTSQESTYNTSNDNVKIPGPGANPTATVNSSNNSISSDSAVKVTVIDADEAGGSGSLSHYPSREKVAGVQHPNTC